jgi:hypothetical protein
MSRALVDEGLKFSVHAMAGKHIAPGVASVSGAWQWTFDGRPSASIGFKIDVQSPSQATLHLAYSHSGEKIDYSMPLVSEACRFGGRRWFAICPRTGRRVSKLYKPNGARHFLARTNWRLAYRSQRSSAGLDRICRQRDRILFKKLKSDNPEAPIKPKWMRWKTYDAHFGKIEDLHRKMDSELAGFIAKLGNFPIS